MSQGFDGIVISVPEAADAVQATIEAARGRLLAVDASAVLSPRVFRERARDQTRALLAVWATLGGRAAEVLAAGLLQRIEEAVADLPSLAGVYWATDMVAEAPPTPEAKKERRELGAKVRAADVRLTRWVGAAVDELGTDDERQAAARLRPGTGRQDNADDVLGWTGIAFGSAAVRGAIPISEAELTAMQKDAVRYSALLGSDEDGAGGPADLRRRAYTLWAGAYELVARNSRHVAQELGLAVTVDGIHPLAGEAVKVPAEPAPSSAPEMHADPGAPEPAPAVGPVG